MNTDNYNVLYSRKLVQIKLGIRPTTITNFSVSVRFTAIVDEVLY